MNTKINPTNTIFQYRLLGEGNSCSKGNQDESINNQINLTHVEDNNINSDTDFATSNNEARQYANDIEVFKKSIEAHHKEIKQISESAFKKMFKQYYLQDIEKFLRLEGCKKDGTNDECKRYAEWQDGLKTFRRVLDIAGKIYGNEDLSTLYKELFEGNNEKKAMFMVLLDILGPTRNNETVKHLVGNEAFEQLCRMQETRKIIGDSNMIGLRDWFNVYGVVAMDIPELPDNIDQILNSDCGIYEDRKVKDTHRLVLMPKMVVKNGKEIEVTFESYCNPNDGLISDVKTEYTAHSKICDWDYEGRFEGEKYKGKEASWSQVSVGEETMWCLVVVGDEKTDNGLLKGSRGKSWDEQVKHVNDVNKDMARLVSEQGLVVSNSEKRSQLYSIARLLELVILAMGFYNKTGDKVLTRNDSDKALSYARTENEWQGWSSGDRLVVGYFDPYGFRVVSRYDDTDLHVAYGIGARRNL